MLQDNKDLTVNWNGKWYLTGACANIVDGSGQVVAKVIASDHGEYASQQRAPHGYTESGLISAVENRRYMRSFDYYNCGYRRPAYILPDKGGA